MKNIALIGDSCKLYPNTGNETTGIIIEGCSVHTADGKQIATDGCKVQFTCLVHKTVEVGTIISNSAHKINGKSVAKTDDKISYCGGADGFIILGSSTHKAE